MPDRSLSARNIIASTLLGTHPPRMHGRLLVALTSCFGIADGTTRVALSRMVQRGELTRHEASYGLHGHLLIRQQHQDDARDQRVVPWDGMWEQAIFVGVANPTRRQDRRRELRGLKLGELREGVWMRPGNLDRERRSKLANHAVQDLQWWRAAPDGGDDILASRLWNLPGWSRDANRLADALRDVAPAIARGDQALLVPGFELSASVLRHLVADPELPPELRPPGWPAAELRDAYDVFDVAYRTLLRRFFDGQR